MSLVMAGTRRLQIQKKFGPLIGWYGFTGYKAQLEKHHMTATPSLYMIPMPVIGLKALHHVFSVGTM